MRDWRRRRKGEKEIPGEQEMMLGDEAAAAAAEVEAASTAAAPSPTAQRAFLRARRRVRQRVDAGEPRNSYSSIPGYSFREGRPQTAKSNPICSLHACRS